MATISEALAIATQHHQAGQLQVAERIYRQILAAEPNHADAWHRLGLIAFQVGRPEVAVEYVGRAIASNGAVADFHSDLGGIYRALGRVPEAVNCLHRALELKPDDARVYYNLAIALNDLGKPEEAIASLRRALELKPDYAEAHNQLGNALKGLQRLDEAVACYRRAVELKPDFAAAHNNLAEVLGRQGKLDDVVASCHRALQLKPDLAEAHYNLGLSLERLGKLDEAVARYRRALELKPDFANAHNNLGNVLRHQEKPDEAIACYRRALELKPDFAEAHSNLGDTLYHQGKPHEAAACCRRALELKPDFADAYNNLANALNDQGKPDEAAACWRRALELKPDYAEAHYNHSLLLLRTGDFQRGWTEYQWRWKVKQWSRFSQALWDGQPLEGKTILLHADQGLGDAIQFVRYAPLVKQRGGAVVVQCPRPLVSLFKSCPGIDRLLGRDEGVPAFDVQAPLSNLAAIFHTALDDIPRAIPYVFPDPGLAERRRGELGLIAGFKIGIFWQGTSRNPARTIPLACFEPLAGLPGVRFFSLQKGPGVEQIQELGGRFSITDLGSRLDHFMDTAAVLVNLDLVITCDTALAHLAGALGVPVWVALPLSPDWRWLLHRGDSPWYPTMRLFRQMEWGNWQAVFVEIESALRQQLLPPANQGPATERNRQ